MHFGMRFRSRVPYHAREIRVHAGRRDSLPVALESRHARYSRMMLAIASRQDDDPLKDGLPAVWTTFALASEDATGKVLGRVVTTTDFSAGDVIQMAAEGGGDGRVYKVIRVLLLEQIGPDRWTNRLVMVRPNRS